MVLSLFLTEQSSIWTTRPPRFRGGQPDQAGRLVNRGNLHCGNFVPTEALADLVDLPLSLHRTIGSRSSIVVVSIGR